MGRIESTFARLRGNRGKALITYLMAGDPSLQQTGRLVLEMEKAGADLIELGVPFSDPMADGPVIQQAAGRALKKGVTLRKVIALVRDLRKKTDIPLILMTYYNPILRYGEEAFVRETREAGVDGVIVPDLTPEEAGGFVELCRPAGLDTIFLLAPTSTDDRIGVVAGASSGFIYYVSMTGITGARLMVDKGIGRHIRKINKASGLPVAVGFGVSTPEEAAAMGRLGEGVIVGSAIVKRIHTKEPLGPFVSELKKALCGGKGRS